MQKLYLLLYSPYIQIVYLIGLFVSFLTRYLFSVARLLLQHPCPFYYSLNVGGA